MQKYFLCLVSLFVCFSSFGFAESIQKTKKDSKEGINSLRDLEKSFNGKIGVYAIDNNSNRVVENRANERFPVQSTMKFIGAAALLKQSEIDSNNDLLHQRLYYSKDDLISWHPVTGLHLSDGMTLEELAEAAVTYSDNVAINVIMKNFGGPKWATKFANSIGNKTYNVTHYDGYMNSSPMSIEDTSTPKDMALSIQKLMFGNGLAAPQQAKLMTWMRNTTTSYKAMRLGVPIGWAVADKTGSGNYGVRNDIGFVWSPSCKPIVLAIYTIQDQKNATKRDDIIAAATTIVLNEFAKYDSCFQDNVLK